MIDLQQSDDPGWQDQKDKDWVLLEFRAEWCAPCREQTQILQQLAKEFEGLVHFRRADIEANAGLAIEMGVQSVPTLVLYKQEREVQRFIGLQGKSRLRNALQACLEQD
ncbi:MAG: thioredoxin domain-containing protein [Desulfohalobiaceae bacterium]